LKVYQLRHAVTKSQSAYPNKFLGTRGKCGMPQKVWQVRFVAPVFTLAITKITMNERTYQEELSKMIEQVEQVHFELLEMRHMDEQEAAAVRQQRYLAYQKAYYASKIKTDAEKMRIRRERGRARWQSKSTKPKKVPLQGVSQGSEAEMETEVDVAKFRLFF
jgi:hypothetical protein